MNPEIFAEWMRRQKHRVFRTKSSYWYEAGPRALQAFPYHWLISPSQQEVDELMTANRMISLRYSTLLNSSLGKVSYHLILHRPYRMDDLTAGERKNVEYGLRHCRIQPISFETLAKEGWSLQQDTLERQKRLRSMTNADWKLICRSASDLPGFEAWGAVSQGELAAAWLICQIDHTWYVPYAISRQRFSSSHIDSALSYQVSSNLLSHDDAEAIFFTVQSLDMHSALEDYSLRTGLVARPVRQRVEFHPWFDNFITPTMPQIFANLLHHANASPSIAKAEGMLRFYLEGQRPFMCQHWPECLLSDQEDRINT